MQIKFYSQFDNSLRVLWFSTFHALNHRRTFSNDPENPIKRIKKKEKSKGEKRKRKKSTELGKKSLETKKSQPQQKISKVIGVISRSSGDRVERRVRSQE